VQSLVLGTAQWGNPYGVTNAQGRLTDETLAEIIAAAKSNGIVAIDTAGMYGDAEARLAPWASGFTITTKVRGADPNTIPAQLQTSLAELGQVSLANCLIHDWAQLTEDQAKASAEQLEDIQREGWVQQIGVSAYDETDLNRAASIFGQLEIAQVPINVLDQRLINSNTLQTLASQGTRIQARSVFLQGLLAARSDTKLGQHPEVVKFHDWCAETGQNSIEVALSFVKTIAPVAEVVIGVTTGAELNDLAHAWATCRQDFDIDGLASCDIGLLDPRTWA
jgi:aryl-alcohol dehydrogenase-like predicted oxidoreductase